MEKQRFNLKASLLLFLAALIWGTAFVAQSVGMDYVEPFTFNGARSLVAVVFLVPVVKILNLKKSAGQKAKEDRATTIRGGVVCGIFLFLAANLQQFGIKYTSVGKSGFITALYIILVPIFSIFLHKKAGIRVWVAALIALAGLYMLCMSEALTLAIGDLMLLLCAIAFSFQILSIDHYSPNVNCVMMSAIEFLVSGVLSVIAMLLVESPELSQVIACWAPILYAGVLSSGVAYTLQIVGQRDLDPTVASLLMSLESVISALSGWLILHQTLSYKELIGCVLMFCAIILAQLPDKKASV